MKKYTLFWKTFSIGSLEINVEGLYNFVRNEEELQKASKAGMLLLLVPESTNGFVEPIALPMLYGRLSRNNLKQSVCYETDYFKLVLNC